MARLSNRNAEGMTFTTEYILIEDYDGRYKPKELRISPEKSTFWTFTQVQLFLNSLQDFMRPARSKITGKIPRIFFSLKFVNNKNSRYYVRLKYDLLTVAFSISGSTDWISDEWVRKKTEYISSSGTQKRKCQNMVLRTFYYFEKYLDVTNEGSFAILKGLDPFFYSRKDFSDAYDGFVSLFCRCKHVSWFTDNTDAAFMYDYYTNWFMRDYSKKTNTYDSFIHNNQGYIKFIVTECTGNEMDSVFITCNDKKYSILGGIYVSPFAQSICSPLNEDIVDGLLMDVTWKVIAGYKTSILMSSICNVGIPLGFAFGPGETKELYNLFYTTFKSVIDIDLSKYIMESDGGTALKSIIADYNQVHLICHNHYLRNLKTKEFSHQVGALTSCKCEIDLNILIDLYSQEFSKYLDNEEKMIRLQKSLQTCGMQFNIEKHKIEITDIDQWKAISMKERVDFKMPSTTNALESSHGHLNALLPRRNDFYTALSRIIDFVIEKTHNFKKAYITNFNRTKRKIEDQTSPFYRPLILKELHQYKSTIDSCECGEVALLNNMLRTNIPCSHKVVKGAQFPKPPDINLELSNSFDEFIVEYDEKKRTRSPHSKDINDFLKTRTIATIRKFSSCKNCVIIDKTVKQFNIDEETQFASKMPLSFYSEVSNGIQNFLDYKKNQKNAD